MAIIASNFKTNHTRKSTKEYIEKLNSFMIEKSIQNDVMFNDDFFFIWVWR